MRLEQSPAWQKLEQLYAASKDTSISSLFEQSPKRADKFKVELDGLYFDYSKTAISPEILDALIALAKQQDVFGLRDKMYEGERINHTDDRAVHHMALRAPLSAAYSVDGHNISQDIHNTLNQMEKLCHTVHSGEWRGYNDDIITDIVHIGIGGSDLGPYMVCEALKNHKKGALNIHFVSNVDGAAIEKTLKAIKPQTTLFLIASKSFTTEETLKNAQTARKWFLEQSSAEEAAIAKHFVAMTVNKIAAIDFGIDSHNIFPFGDYVGGRFSLWSSIGLPIALYLGFDKFQELLAGAHTMDTHFKTARAEENLPLILGLIGVWHRNFCDYESLAVLPYAQDLQHFPAFLQQMDMESNGKEIDCNGEAMDCATGPVIFGASGTNGQHAFYQLIHQSKTIIPCEFIAFKTPLSSHQNHHDSLLSHVVAQSRALMIGRKGDEIKDQPETYFSGNRPSTTLILDELTPHSLGQLIALYEHKIFVQGAVWGLNSFDQPGVELGKILAKEISVAIDAFKSGKKPEKRLDPSSYKLLKYLYK